MNSDKSYIGLAVVLVSMYCTQADARDRVQVSRYTYASVEAEREEKDLLSVVVQIRFPGRIEKTGEAIDYLLEQSGYRLDVEASRAHSLLYHFDLPQVHRRMGPVRLIEALRVLAGEGFVLNVNPVQRTIRYEIDPEYASLITQAELRAAHSRWKAARQDAEALRADGAEAVYGPVVPGETLLGIAATIASTTAASVERTAVGLYRLNPDSFGTNMNLLFAGTTLRIPSTADLESIDQRLARRVLHQHMRRGH